jgi:hypothetical protein
MRSRVRASTTLFALGQIEGGVGNFSTVGPAPLRGHEAASYVVD